MLGKISTVPRQSILQHPKNSICVLGCVHKCYTKRLPLHDSASSSNDLFRDDEQGPDGNKPITKHHNMRILYQNLPQYHQLYSANELLMLKRFQNCIVAVRFKAMYQLKPSKIYSFYQVQNINRLSKSMNLQNFLCPLPPLFSIKHKVGYFSYTALLSICSKILKMHCAVTRMQNVHLNLHALHNLK